MVIHGLLKQVSLLFFLLVFSFIYISSDGPNPIPHHPMTNLTHQSKKQIIQYDPLVTSILQKFPPANPPTTASSATSASTTSASSSSSSSTTTSSAIASPPGVSSPPTVQANMPPPPAPNGTPQRMVSFIFCSFIYYLFSLN